MGKIQSKEITIPPISAENEGFKSLFVRGITGDFNQCAMGLPAGTRFSDFRRRRDSRWILPPIAHGKPLRYKLLRKGSTLWETSAEMLPCGMWWANVRRRSSRDKEEGECPDFWTVPVEKYPETPVNECEIDESCTSNPRHKCCGTEVSGTGKCVLPKAYGQKTARPINESDIKRCY